MKKNLLISTGGTGGHVIPALTFYDHLKNHFKVSILTDQRGTKFISNNYSYDVIYTPKITSNLLSKKSEKLKLLKRSPYYFHYQKHNHPNSSLHFH